MTKGRLPGLSAKSDTTKAINYALNQWQALLRYYSDGMEDIDNNAAERALRCVALGHKNFLLMGADSGGERAAAMYTLIGTARHYGIDPEAYLRYVLTHIAPSSRSIGSTICCPGTSSQASPNLLRQQTKHRTRAPAKMNAVLVHRLHRHSV